MVMASQQQSSMTPTEFRDAWRTPPYLFHWLNKQFNFDIDLCADKENKLVHSYISVQSDSLTVDWHKLGKVGFCNPPFSNQWGFINKAIDEAMRGFVTVMVLPCFNGQAYWKHVYDHAEVTNIVGRINYLSPCDYTRVVNKKKVQVKKGQPVPGNTSGTCIVVFGATLARDYVMRTDMIEYYETGGIK